MTEEVESDQDGSVTVSLKGIVMGEEESVGFLAGRYFSQIETYANYLILGRKTLADGEDIANTVLHLFFKGVKGGRFREVKDRDALWRLLVTMVARKVIDEARHETRQKRGGGKVKIEADMGSSSRSESAMVSIDHIKGDEKLPELGLMVNEQYEYLVEKLKTPTRKEIIRLRLLGYTNQEVAEELNISIRHVEKTNQDAREILEGRLLF